MASADERLSEFRTLRDWFRHAVTRFVEAKIAFGHGTENAVDEAAFVVLEALHLPIESIDPFLDARLTLKERSRLAELIDARVETRKPAAYLLGRAYIQDVAFFVDERTIVPRSFLGELLSRGFGGDDSFVEDPSAIRTVLDLCTGGGSLAILAAMAFENATVDAVDLSAAALEVAQRNVADHALESQVRLIQGDLFAPLAGRRYELIFSNPPYVTSAAVAAFPPEYAAEPRMAHDGGADGLDIVRRIIAEAPDHLTKDGVLICEIGQGRENLITSFPALPFLWLDTQTSVGEVFVLRAHDFAKAGKSGKGARVKH
jgi:ribosomal protein L3 glutamine methyltransferase